MKITAEKLPDDPLLLKKIIVDHQEKIRYLEEQLRLLQNEIFGRKSEKRPVFDEKQQLLFEPIDPAVDDKLAPEAADDERLVVPAHSRKKPGRKPLPADLPRIDVLHDLAESEKACPCGSPLKRIGQEVCEKLDYVPATLRVERHIRFKYACPVCEGVEDDGPTVKIAPAPAQLIPKSMATAGLVAHIAVAKFEDALPLYRQEKMFARLGIELPRATMAGWMVKGAQASDRLLELFCQQIRGGPLVNIDETPLQVLQEPGRANTAKSYMWIFRGGDPDRPCIVYRYHPSRSGQVPLEFLDGYRGYVQTDGYNGYEALGRKPGVILVGCWAHARRKFDKVIKATGSSKKQNAADQALDYIGRLYAIEKRARQEELSPEAIRQLRRQEAGPVLDEFKTWLDDMAVRTPPKGLLGKAVNYTVSYWSRLVRYLEDGRLQPDNNLAENAIRPFVVGRKNWLFAGHPNGAAASATFYSLIETAKANGLKPHSYLRYLFDRLPLAQTVADYQNLLPQNLDPADIDPAAA